MAGEGDSFVFVILAIIFPPAAAAFVAGCGVDLCLNILLTLMGYLPGCIHAFWLIMKRSEADERYGYKNWTYRGMGEYVPGQAEPPSSAPPHGPGQPPMPPPPGQYVPVGTAPKPSQAPEGQKAEYAAPPLQAPAESKGGGYQTADTKLGADQKQATPTAQSAAPPPFSTTSESKGGGDQTTDQKSGENAQTSADQKQAEPTAQSAAPPPFNAT